MKYVRIKALYAVSSSITSRTSSRIIPLLMHRSAFIRLLSIFCILGVALFSVHPAKAHATRSIPLEKRYAIAKDTFNQLVNGSSKGSSRDDWEKCAATFKKIYQSDPHSSYAPKCLFMLGKTYQQMFGRFKIKKDLDDSINSYQECTSLFPDDNLADDALWAIANIYLDNLNNPGKAVEILKNIVAQYPKGDMQQRASAELKALDSDQSTAFQRGANSPGSKQVNHVLPVKYWSSHDYTRIVIESSGPVAFKDQLLEKVGDQPRRLYIDFANSYVKPQYRAPVPIEDGLLKKIRTGQYNADTVRVVLDIESISSYKVFSLPDPFRVVVDIRGTAPQESPASVEQNEKIEPATQDEQPSPQVEPEVTASLPASEVQSQPPVNQEVIKDKEPTPPAQRTPQVVQTKNIPKPPVENIVKPPPVVKTGPPGKPLSLAQQLGLRVKKIVIDPGHGGKDPGAMGNGLKEKDIVLKVAKRLAPLLESRMGCKVILTRNRDVFIPLEERTAIANKNDADLFISLHVNSSDAATANGIETYYLNLTSNPEAMRVAALENSTSTHQMSDLQNILSDILKNSKINESSHLAQHVHNSVLGGLEKDYPHIKNLGVKQAPFYVLIGAEMPAILVEMSFISNPEDAQRLKDEQFLDQLASEIALGVQSYVNANSASAQGTRRK